MQRPKGVIVIAVLFAVIAVYLWTVAVVRLMSPDAISLMATAYFLQELALAGPYMILLGGCVYGLVAFGLFRLQNWARWVAMLIFVLSIMPLIASISVASLGASAIWNGLQISLRVAAGWYLAQAPSVIDAFAGKPS